MKKQNLSDSGHDFIWEPETLKEYMEVADADLRLDEVFDVLPELVGVELYARRALQQGVSLIRSFRAGGAALRERISGDFEQTDGCAVFWVVNHGWVLGVCRLWIYISEILCALDNPPCDEYWPSRPGIEGLGAVGRAALEVAELFAISVGDIAFDALKSACEREDFRDMTYDFVEQERVTLEPAFEPRALRWMEGVKEGLAKTYPTSRWPDVLLDRDCRRLAIVLGSEQKEALGAQKEAEMQRSAKPSGRSPESRESGAGHQLLGALGELDAFMSCADLALVFNVAPESLRKRLERHREKHALDPDIYVEIQDGGLRKARYLYSVRIAAEISRRIRARTVSDERPPEEKDG